MSEDVSERPDNAVREYLTECFRWYDALPAEGLWPTCSCLLGPELGVPTRAARGLIEVQRRRGNLVPVNLDRFIAQLPADDLTRAEAYARRQLFGGVEAFFPFTMVTAPEAEDALIAMSRDLLLMLAVREQVFRGDDARTKYCHQASIQALRTMAATSQLEPTGWRFPLGLKLAGQHTPLRTYYSQLRSGEVEYERFEVSMVTQLRVICLLAFTIADGPQDNPLPWVSERLATATRDERELLLRRLGNALVEGLELPVYARPPVLPTYLSQTEVRVVSPDEDGVQTFVEWATSEAVRRPVPNGEESEYSQAVWAVLRELDFDQYPPDRFDRIVERAFSDDPVSTNLLRFERATLDVLPASTLNF